MIKVFFICIMLLLIKGCSEQQESLVIYSGKGLKHAVDDVVKRYEHIHGGNVSVIYAGSNTLFNTLMKSKKGDIFIPGSRHYINKADKYITRSEFVALHVPTFVIRKDNNKSINNFSDLLSPGIKIAIGNKEVAAIGKVAETILKKSTQQDSFKHNITVKGSTVNELMQFVIDGHVDTALIWADMITWNNATELKLINIPEHLIKPKEIWAAQLSFSQSPEQSADFMDFMSSDGQAIFKKHGFDINR
jgi:molybdate transport system substrate-binding protein